jgi:hypothetical protein
VIDGKIYRAAVDEAKKPKTENEEGATKKETPKPAEKNRTRKRS